MSFILVEVKLSIWKASLTRYINFNLEVIFLKKNTTNLTIWISFKFIIQNDKEIEKDICDILHYLQYYIYSIMVTWNISWFPLSDIIFFLDLCCILFYLFSIHQSSSHKYLLVIFVIESLSTSKVCIIKTNKRWENLKLVEKSWSSSINWYWEE